MPSTNPTSMPSARGDRGARPHATPRGRLGYDGQLHEPHGCWQFLGNGYRIYNPVLMRLHSPDTVSPFGEGGINAYAYCGGDPINNVDPTGRFALPLALLMGAGAIAAGVATTASTLSGNEDAAMVFGTITGLLGTAAAVTGTGYVLRMSGHARPPRPVVRIENVWGKNSEAIIRQRRVPGGVVTSIVAHGEPYSTGWGAKALNGRQLVKRVKAATGGRVSADFVQLNTCYGAAGGTSASTAQVLADGLRRPVLAYEGVTSGGWQISTRVTSPGPVRFFYPQSGRAAAATAHLNARLHRRLWREYARRSGNVMR